MEERAIDRLRQFVLYLKQNKTKPGPASLKRHAGCRTSILPIRLQKEGREPWGLTSYREYIQNTRN